MAKKRDLGFRFFCLNIGLKQRIVYICYNNS